MYSLLLNDMICHVSTNIMKTKVFCTVHVTNPSRLITQFRGGRAKYWTQAAFGAPFQVYLSRQIYLTILEM